VTPAPVDSAWGMDMRIALRAERSARRNISFRHADGLVGTLVLRVRLVSPADFVRRAVPRLQQRSDCSSGVGAAFALACATGLRGSRAGSE
jgi:hypothetical protein